MDLRAADSRTRLKKAAALLQRMAAIALRQVDVLPVRNRLARERPETPVQHAQLMVVDRHVHTGVGQNPRSLAELLLVVSRVDPKLAQVLVYEAGHLQPHQRDLPREREIARDERRQL